VLTWPLLSFIAWITVQGIHRPILEISLAQAEVQAEAPAGVPHFSLPLGEVGCSSSMNWRFGELQTLGRSRTAGEA
jgi:hypothetical protein